MNIRILAPFNLISIIFRSIIFAKENYSQIPQILNTHAHISNLTNYVSEDVIDQSGNVNSICFIRSVNVLKVVPVIPIGQGLD